MSEISRQSLDNAASQWAAEAKARNAASIANWTPPPRPSGNFYEYSVEPHDERYAFESKFTPDSKHWLAEDAAEDFFHNHDGWECKWPMVFNVYDDDKHLGRYSVDVEHQPHFSATRQGAA